MFHAIQAIDQRGFAIVGKLHGSLLRVGALTGAAMTDVQHSLRTWKARFRATSALLEIDAARGLTIGQFYSLISNMIGEVGDKAFINPPRNQIGPALMPDAVIVTNVATAQQAIRTIVEEGEGTSKSPTEVVGRYRYAHYYRLMQIKQGRKLVKDQSGYSYSGDSIVFDPSGVYDVPGNPKVADYPSGSAQRRACNNFNYTYTSLLKTLHALFNGQTPGDRFNAVIGLMMSLKAQATAMMSGIPNPAAKPLPAPSFEYQPVDPGSAQAFDAQTIPSELQPNR
ncbi:MULTISPECIES: ferritin-like protein [Burkholderia]|uniref:ferritin-like protein n=1 Tax=Burkholderia TaxID=32008 RepID=UPI001E3DB391|nr:MULTISPECIES: ferritin-like protein [Burkholderia]